MEQDSYIISLKAKLSRVGIKVVNVLQCCEDWDRNNDGLLHVADLEKVFESLFSSRGAAPEDGITKRELRALVASVTDSKDKIETQIEYQKLLRALQPREARRVIEKQKGGERWYEGGGDEDGEGFLHERETLTQHPKSALRSRTHRSPRVGYVIPPTYGNSSTRNQYWAQSRGTVGEWLTKSACPSEVKAFKKLISALERFEREAGTTITTEADGSLSIPLGPDLKATINFSS